LDYIFGIGPAPPNYRVLLFTFQMTTKKRTIKSM